MLHSQTDVGVKTVCWALKFLFVCFLIILFIYLFLAALGLCCCTGAFSSCNKRMEATL